MIEQTTAFLEKHRTAGARGELYGNFLLPGPTKRQGLQLRVICGLGDELEWQKLNLPLPAFEHVSVSVVLPKGQKARCPTWEEMTYIKDLFWQAEELVVQYHPPRSQYKNFHPYVLHLWKVRGMTIPLPPIYCV